MLDWNHNGSYDAFDSATDYMLSGDMDSSASGSAKYAANQKDKPVLPQEEMKPWQYLFTIYFMLGIVYAVIFFFFPCSSLCSSSCHTFHDFLVKQQEQNNQRYRDHDYCCHHCRHIFTAKSIFPDLLNSV